MDVNVVVVELVVVDVAEVELVVVALVVVPGRRTIVVESVLIWHLTRGVNKSLSNYTNDEMNTWSRATSTCSGKLQLSHCSPRSPGQGTDVIIFTFLFLVFVSGGGGGVFEIIGNMGELTVHL